MKNGPGGLISDFRETDSRFQVGFNMAGLFIAGRRPKASEPREPKARFGHATVVVDNNLLVWGGEDVYETSTVETFDVSSLVSHLAGAATATWRHSPHWPL